MRLIKSTPKGTQRVYDIEVADVHNFYANGVNVHNCATAGGASIIRDDGTVVNITFSDFNIVYKTGFLDTTKVYILNDDNSRKRFVHIYDIPTSTITQATNGYRLGSALEFYQTENDGVSPSLTAFNSTNYNADVYDIANRNYGTSGGLIKVDANTTSPSNGLLNIITSSYNTGWMHGDIKGAWLSDTSTASVTGTELITNGTFDSNVTGWTTNTSTNTWSSGTMQITRSGGGGYTSYQAFTTVVGQRYVASATINSSGSRGDLLIFNGTGTAGTQIGGTVGTNGQTLTLTSYFTATSTTTSIAFGVDNNATSIFVDNVSVRREESDRSVNAKGLAVYGTLTKTAVATGADLVYYGGFSLSNYLQQVNVNINFANPWYMMGWFPTGNGTVSLEKFSTSSYNNTVAALFASNGYQSSRSKFSDLVDTATYEKFFSLVYSNGVLFHYAGGSLVRTISGTYTTETADLLIGIRSYSNAYDAVTSNQGVSLLRIGQAAPSADQIKKIYNDEKALFQENSKATLYGSSDAVTALAYDDTTKLLSVGTSSGRSDFQGLKRINNTTTAVTTAISASNGLIAEQ